MKNKKNNFSTFTKLPDFLIHNEPYCHISNDAKILYALLLNRHSLSEKTGWKDERGIYIIFTRQKMAEELGCSLRKVSYLIKELRKVKLIREKRFGLNKPNYIYVQKPTSDQNIKSKEKKQTTTQSKQTLQTPYSQGHANIASLDKQILHPNKTEKDLNLYSFIENRFSTMDYKIEKMIEDQKKLQKKVYWNNKNNQKQSALHFDSNQESKYSMENLTAFSI